GARGPALPWPWAGVAADPAPDGDAVEDAGIAAADDEVAGYGHVRGVTVAMRGQRRGGGPGAEGEAGGGERHGGQGDQRTGRGTHEELLMPSARSSGVDGW